MTLKRAGMAMMVWGMLQTVTSAQTEPSARELPRWRGFSLLEMFHKDSSPGPFEEQDFRLISEWGFGFVRLPKDYRPWTQDGDWTRFNENTLRWMEDCLKNFQEAGLG